MRITSVHVVGFKRFADLTITGIPESARLIVLAGPNGSGKSSLFDAFLNRYRTTIANYGGTNLPWYYDRVGGLAQAAPTERITIMFDSAISADLEERRKMFYFRSAHRNDPEFRLQSLSRMQPISTDVRLQRMIETDATVMANYQRIASRAVEDVLVNEQPQTTIGQYRDRMIGEIRQSMQALFPDLVFSNLGNPVDNGTFFFDKGAVSGFEYLNLSGGEKAAFDLILDIIVKRHQFDNTVYCIDEPEAHMNARIQADLLEELMRLLPGSSQMWVATHSIGMMRKAREIGSRAPGSVVFLDFGNHDFDTTAVMTPVAPTRTFWEGALSVALDDLSQLVAPKEVVVCEGNPLTSIPGKNIALDASCYNTIFSDERPDTKFLSGGNSAEVAGDRLGFVAAISALADGIAVKRLIDRDDHGPADIATYKAAGIAVLSRRHVESYLFDDEVLTALCSEHGRLGAVPQLLAAKVSAIRESVERGNPVDDVKSASGTIYNEAKRILGLVGVGNNASAFMRQTLAPLVRPGTATYADLARDIFGP